MSMMGSGPKSMVQMASTSGVTRNFTLASMSAWVMPSSARPVRRKSAVEVVSTMNHTSATVAAFLAMSSAVWVAPVESVM